MEELDGLIEKWREQYTKSMKINNFSLYSAIASEVMCLLNVAIQDEVIELIFFTFGAVLSICLIASAVARRMELYNRNLKIEMYYQDAKFWDTIYSENKTDV